MEHSPFARNRLHSFPSEAVQRQTLDEFQQQYGWLLALEGAVRRSVAGVITASD